GVPAAAERRLWLRRDRQHSLAAVGNRCGAALARPEKDSQSAGPPGTGCHAPMGAQSMLMPKTIHPTSRTLIAYMDGELPVDERFEIQAHVCECSTCRDELDTMESDLDWFLVLEAASR